MVAGKKAGRRRKLRLMCDNGRLHSKIFFFILKLETTRTISGFQYLQFVVFQKVTCLLRADHQSAGKAPKPQEEDDPGHQGAARYIRQTSQNPVAAVVATN